MSQPSTVIDLFERRREFLSAARARYSAASESQRWARLEEIEERLRDLKSKFGLMISELGEVCELESERDFLVHPRDKRHSRGFVFDNELGYVDVWWGGYEYSIKLDRITTPMDILQWLNHIGGKQWRGMTGPRVAEFIDAIARRKGWNIHESHGHVPKRTTSDADERAKLTPQLRYSVLKRDNFRCRACGSGPENGATLHMDHIHPISRGGVTTFENLQALCTMCNSGKGARR